MNDLKEQLFEDGRCRIIDEFLIREGIYTFVAHSHRWAVDQMTEKAALITLFDHLETFGIKWVPKSVLAFSPSGDIYFKTWFYNKILNCANQ